MIHFAIRHCPKKSEPLENVIKRIKKSGLYSYGNRRADNGFVFVIQTINTTPVQYELGYGYKVSSSEKQAGGYKWHDVYNFKHIPDRESPIYYFEKPKFIDNDDFREWFSSSEVTRQGMAEVPDEHIKLLIDMFQNS
jgi:mannose-1-phosphate guanylyltransferase